MQTASSQMSGAKYMINAASIVHLNHVARFIENANHGIT
jgi:hypothetical protein